jgi:Cu-Zn family superoxide dismutase
MKPRLIIPMVAAVTAAGVAAASAATAHNPSSRATIAAADGTRLGTVEFRSERDGVRVRVRLVSVPGTGTFHGFHIHANDVPSNGDGCIADATAAAPTWFTSADGHYNPTGETHAHHAGDMPVLYVNGVGTVDAQFHLDRLDPRELEGKVVIVRAGPTRSAATNRPRRGGRPCCAGPARTTGPRHRSSLHVPCKRGRAAPAVRVDQHGRVRSG